MEFIENNEGSMRIMSNKNECHEISEKCAGKYQRLIKLLSEKKRVLVSFSGGVDSSLLAKVARDVLGNYAVAVTINSEALPREDLRDAKRVAGDIGIEHRVVDYKLLDSVKFTENSKERCYYCKKEFAGILKKIATGMGMDIGIGGDDSILDGTNADDLKEDRPGIRALNEFGILSPLADVGLGKNDVRVLAKKIGLSTAKKPSGTCLATRIPHGTKITRKELERIEKAERFIRGQGISDVRVRSHGEIARIEVPPDDIKLILNVKNRRMIVKKLKEFGFKYITISL